MAEERGITKYFSCVEGPLPIRWTQLAEHPSKKPKRGHGRQRKHQQAPTMVKISDSDHSEHDEPNDEQGEDTVAVFPTKRFERFF